MSLKGRNDMLKLFVFFGLLLGTANLGIAAEKLSKGTSEAVLIKQGAVRLSASQIRGLLVGSTEAAKYERSKWPVTFYAPDGMMYIKLPSGKRTVEGYKLKSDGGVCYGSSFSKCHYFYRVKGELVAVRSGRVLGVATISRGKRL